MSISLAQPGAGWLDDVWTRLDMVSDPELDQSVAEMGFVNSVEIGAGGAVRISFRLPTFWCAPNFAFLMAHDMREAVERLVALHPDGDEYEHVAGQAPRTRYRGRVRVIPRGA